MKIVCVTGMHRSGTSLVGRVVNLLGVDLGPEDQIMEPKADNPAGFWENTSISALNDDLLAALGGSWNEPPVLADGWETDARLDEMRTRARTTLEDTLGGVGADVVGWKDPRMSIVLPFWRTVAPIEATVMAVRRPRDVAASLARRDNLSREESAALWLRYVVAAWRNDPGRIVVDYDAFFADSAGASTRLARALGLAEPDDDTLERIATFVDPQLRHRSKSRSSGPATKLANALYHILVSGDPATTDAMADHLHAAWVAAAESAARATRIANLEIELGVALDHRDELMSERDVAIEHADRLTLEMEQLAAAHEKILADRDTALARADAVLAELDEVRTTLEAQVAELAGELEELVTRHEEALQERDSALANRDEVAAELAEARQVLGERIEGLIADRAAVEETLGAQVEELTRQLEQDRDVLGRRIDELAAHRDQLAEERQTALAMRDEEHDRRLHFEERVALQRQLIERNEAEAKRIAGMLDEVQARALELEQRNEGLEVIIRRWRVDKLERLRHRLGFRS